MMIKFLARGTGSAVAAADYLTREESPEQDREKNPEEVTVLRGNPDQVAAVADALEFEHKSGRSRRTTHSWIHVLTCV